MHLHELLPPQLVLKLVLKKAEPQHFKNSQLIKSREWDTQLHSWFGDENKKWVLCCSTFEGCDTASNFHSACDDMMPTLVVAHNAGGTYNGRTNPGNFTFGGFVRMRILPLYAYLSSPATYCTAMQ